jgi:outer membrane protein
MKNLSLALNIILLVAVAVLYVLYFSGRKSGSQTASSSDTSIVDLKIAYINSDSVLKHYEFFNETRDGLEKKAKAMEQDFQNRYNDLQSEAQAYERNVNNMTYGQVQSAKENLAKKENNLRVFQQSLQQAVMNDETKMNKELYDRVTEFLKGYSKEKGIQVVLKYDPSSDVLYGGSALDITNQVIDGLNAAYKHEKTNPKPKADQPK